MDQHEVAWVLVSCGMVMVCCNQFDWLGIGLVVAGLILLVWPETPKGVS